MEIAFVGETHDKIAVCRHCRTTVDLPDTRGTTHETITERPGERIVERVTEWQSDFAPDLGAIFEGLGLGPDELQQLAPAGRRFISEDEFREHVRKTLSPKSAEQVLRGMDARRSANAPQGVTVVRRVVTGAARKVMVFDGQEFDSLEKMLQHVRGKYPPEVARQLEAQLELLWGEGSAAATPPASAPGPARTRRVYKASLSAVRIDEPDRGRTPGGKSEGLFASLRRLFFGR